MLAQLEVNSILVPCAYARGSYPTLSAKPSVSVKLIYTKGSQSFLQYVQQRTLPWQIKSTDLIDTCIIDTIRI